MANPKVFGIITLAVLLASGLVALKNKKAYERMLELQGAAQSDLRISQERFNEAKDALNATLETSEELEGEIVRLEDAEAEQKKANLALKASLEEKTGQVAEYKGKPEEIEQQSERLERIRETIAKIVRANDEIEQLEATIAKSQAELDKLAAANGEIAKDVNALREQIQAVSTGRSLASLQTSIRSVYPSWGFVTLFDGAESGVVMNSTLDVLRDGETIGKLLVAAVESNSASANIIPDSLAPGVVLMSGDQVVPASTAQN